MGFILCDKYINTDIDFKQVECDVYDVVLYFHSEHDRNDYEN